MIDDTTTCDACEETAWLDEAVEDGWILAVELNDGGESGMALCQTCAMRYLDIDNRMPIQTYEMILKIQAIA
jgi:hypothetical protein